MFVSTEVFLESPFSPFLSGIAVAPRYARHQFSKVSLLLHVIVLPAVVTLRQKHRSIPQYDSEGCCAMCIRVEWFSLFCDFRKRAHCYRLAIFLWVQFQKIGEFCRQNFHFQKITGTLKMNIFFKSWHEPSFYIKDQLPKIEFKIRDCLAFFLFFKNGENSF